MFVFFSIQLYYHKILHIITYIIFSVFQIEFFENILKVFFFFHFIFLVFLECFSGLGVV